MTLAVTARDSKFPSRVVPLLKKAMDAGTAEKLHEVFHDDEPLRQQLVALARWAGVPLEPSTSSDQLTDALGVEGVRAAAAILTICEMAPRDYTGQTLLRNCVHRACAGALLAEGSEIVTPLQGAALGFALEAAMLSNARGDGERLANIAKTPAVHRTVHEKAFGLVTHPAAGSQLASELGFSVELCRAVERHHAVEMPGDPPSRFAWVVERCAGVLEAGALQSNLDRARQACRGLDIEEAYIERLIDEISTRAEAFSETLELGLDAFESIETMRDAAAQRCEEMMHQYDQMASMLDGLVDRKRSLARQLQEANQRMQLLAATDPLTGLANRRTFDEALRRDIARADRMHSTLGVLVFDLDGFQRINDEYGHGAGDQLLKAIAKMLRTVLRSTDIPARIGGEDFAVVLPEADLAGANLVAERLRSAVEETTVEVRATALSVTASFGIASVQGPGCAKAGSTLFARADEARQEAKRRGRNQVVHAE